MLFHGLQKMTLLDYPGKVAATVFTAGCNLRCPFCHNAFLVTEIKNSEVFSEEEILSFLKSRVGILDGVAVTGGEPLLQTGMHNFIRKVKEMGYLVKLDTNGSFPDMLSDLIEEKLIDYVAVDIKNCKEKYAKTVGVEDFDLSPIERTVNLLKEGKVDYEFRTTVVKEFHTPEDIRKITEWIAPSPRYFLQNFVDSGNLIGDSLHPQTKEILEEMKKIGAEKIPLTELRGV